MDNVTSKRRYSGSITFIIINVTKPQNYDNMQGQKCDAFQL